MAWLVSTQSSEDSRRVLAGWVVNLIMMLSLIASSIVLHTMKCSKATSTMRQLECDLSFESTFVSFKSPSFLRTWRDTATMADIALQVGQISCRFLWMISCLQPPAPVDSLQRGQLILTRVLSICLLSIAFVKYQLHVCVDLSKCDRSWQLDCQFYITAIY